MRSSSQPNAVGGGWVRALAPFLCFHLARRKKKKEDPLRPKRVDLIRDADDSRINHIPYMTYMII